MTIQKYVELVKQDDHVCPACGASDPEGEGVEIEGVRATQECSCGECGSTWTLVFTLTYYELTYDGTD